jgi:hypothetical protein
MRYRKPYKAILTQNIYHATLEIEAKEPCAIMIAGSREELQPGDKRTYRFDIEVIEEAP